VQQQQQQQLQQQTKRSNFQFGVPRANRTGGHAQSDSIGCPACICMHSSEHLTALHHVADPAMPVHEMLAW